jgi:hypothetical protein
MSDPNFLSVTPSSTLTETEQNITFAVFSTEEAERRIDWYATGLDSSRYVSPAVNGYFPISDGAPNSVFFDVYRENILPPLSLLYQTGGGTIDNVPVRYIDDTNLTTNDYWVSFYAHKTNPDDELSTDAQIILRGQYGAEDIILTNDDFNDTGTYIQIRTNEIVRGESYKIELAAGSLIEAAAELTITFTSNGNEVGSSSIFIEDPNQSSAMQLFLQTYTINNDVSDPVILDFGFVSKNSGSNYADISSGLTDFIPVSDADELTSNPDYLYFTFDSDLVQSNWWGLATDIKVYLGTDTTASNYFTLDTDLYHAPSTGDDYWDVDLDTIPNGFQWQHANGLQVDGDSGEIAQYGDTLIFRIDEEMFELGQTYTLVANIGALDFGDNRMTQPQSFAFTFGQSPSYPDKFYVDPLDTIQALKTQQAGNGPLNTIVLPDNAGDVYFEFDQDVPGSVDVDGFGTTLFTYNTSVWTNLVDGFVEFQDGFNGIAAGDGNDSLFGSDANSEIFAPGGFNEAGISQNYQDGDYRIANTVYGGDDDSNDTFDYVDYRSETQFQSLMQTIVLAPSIVYTPMTQSFDGVSLALEDNNGLDGVSTVQRSMYAYDEISSIEGVLGSLRNDFLDARLIGASGAVLAGFEGNDFLIGSDSDDVLVGGSGNDVLVAGNELEGVNYLEGGTGRDVIVASDAKDLFFVRIGDGNETSGSSSAEEQVVDFQLSGDSAKFVGRDNLVKDEFLFVSDGTSPVTADFDNATKTLRISSGDNSYYSVTVDIKTESGTPTTSYEADAVVGGRDDDIIVLSGKGSDIKGDIAIGGQGSDLYEVRMVSDLRIANDPLIPTNEFDKITIREMGARGGNNNFDGILIEGVRDIWGDITLARSIDGKSLEIDYEQYTHNDSTDTYIQQSQGELNVYKQYDYKAPHYRVEKLALQDADDGTTTIFNLGMNAKAGTSGFTEKISAVEFDTSVSTDLKFDGENHWLVGSGKDIYDLSGLENDAVVMLTGFDTQDKLLLSDEYVYEYHDYDADVTDSALQALFIEAGIGGGNFFDTGRDGVLVVAKQDSIESSAIDHWMILMSDPSTNLFDQFQQKLPEMA